MAETYTKSDGWPWKVNKVGAGWFNIAQLGFILSVANRSRIGIFPVLGGLNSKAHALAFVYLSNHIQIQHGFFRFGLRSRFLLLPTPSVAIGQSRVCSDDDRATYIMCRNSTSRAQFTL